MKLNKLYLICFSLLLAVVFTGCSKKEADMNVLSDDGQYHYRNESLKFSVNLPADFIYYQTQRKDKTNYTDIEFFVPTTDTDYAQEVPGYAKPMAVRVFKKADWKAISSNQASSTDYSSLIGDDDVVLNEKGGYTYVIKYWANIPNDWQDKWNDEMKKKIEESFKRN